MNKITQYVLATAFIMINAVAFCQEKEIKEDVAFAVIEQVPIYPGCEQYKTNAELKKCMSQKISEHVGAKFRLSIGPSSGLAGRQRISVQFRINKDGIVDQLRARGPHPNLEKEAKRVLAELPVMKPGIQKGKPVGVLYSLPIIFNVKETKAQKRARKKLDRKNKIENNN